MMAEEIFIAPEHFRQMREHVAEMEPMEACGLLGGARSQVQKVVPVKNVAESQARFRMDPAEQIEALFGFEEQGIELLAIYHSHPGGPAGPSQTDLREAAYPEAFHVIWFLEQAEWVCRAYRYAPHAAVEAPIVIRSGEQEHRSHDQE